MKTKLVYYLTRNGKYLIFAGNEAHETEKFSDVDLFDSQMIAEETAEDAGIYDYTVEEKYIVEIESLCTMIRQQIKHLRTLAENLDLNYSARPADLLNVHAQKREFIAGAEELKYLLQKIDEKICID